MEDDIIEIIERVITKEGIRPYICNGMHEFKNVKWEDIDNEMYVECLGAYIAPFSDKKEKDEYENKVLTMMSIEYDDSMKKCKIPHWEIISIKEEIEEYEDKCSYNRK